MWSYVNWNNGYIAVKPTAQWKDISVRGNEKVKSGHTDDAKTICLYV